MFNGMVCEIQYGVLHMFLGFGLIGMDPCYQWPYINFDVFKGVASIKLL